MAFWGVEVKPSKPYTHRFDDESGAKLHISQATLGTGSSTKKSILQCNVGDKKPVYLCSLLPEKFENCPLNLEFEEEDEVIFSVIGPHSIHLSGFFLAGTPDCCRDDDESDSYGEDIAGTESDESTDYDIEDEYDDDNNFIVEDLDMYPPSPVPNSGVVIEEILDDEKPADGNGIAKRGKKKAQFSTSYDNGDSERQLILKSDTGASILESEDEDGFPISSPQKNKADAGSIKGKAGQNKDTRTDDESKKGTKGDRACVEILKRKVDAILQVGEQKSREANEQLGSSLASAEVVPEADKKKKKKKKKNEEKTGDAGSKSNIQTKAATTDMEQDQPVQKEHDEKDLDIDADSKAEEKKRKKKKSKKQSSNTDTDLSVPEKIVSTKEDIEKETGSKPFQVRTFPNGLVIEELAMGKPDGKKASPGKKVSVRYIGKLKKNGEIFDSNIGRAPFKFRLGVGEVIKGWDVGVNGMRVGDRRRLTIPPAMGYGAKGAGRAIPPNSWLVFDVELVEVR
ncbi:peptidyl-prolyl cis-trans isomerase FKBP53 isoform X1 [Rhododendron vialii]|uniref:peptidyl-prolyl cis-trans isomerase FKBP53 isoform X1 n=1 Tax=Rhododendron vialii TaxID=182163 RepID=UPI00265E6DD3|nr:peptidyl-prolyl cis-trans isomerase FKBP53 isoform X1 [Rhododendron vialii]